MPRETPPDPATDQMGRFPEARNVHDAIREAPTAYPPGWIEQVRFRERYDLPPFRPPRFESGEDVASTVARLEADHGIDVSFVAYAPSQWVVEVDGELAFGLSRRRDDASNVVLETTAETFEERIREGIETTAGPGGTDES